METLPLDQQKKAVLYAPKDLLWKIAEEEDAWLKLLGILPDPYYNQFLGKLRLLGVEDRAQIKTMAKVYIKNKVRMDHLQEAVAAAWHPSDLEEATSYLKELGVLNRPLMPLNLQAEVEEVVKEAQALSLSTKLRLARRAHGVSPKIGHPPDGASPEAAKCWNQVLKDPKRRKIILGPKSVEDQWALAHKFWLKECSRQEVPAYKSPASSASQRASSSLQRALHDTYDALCGAGYTMSRPASRMFRQLFDQLKEDGHEVGDWRSIKPRTPKGI